MRKNKDFFAISMYLCSAMSKDYSSQPSAPQKIVLIDADGVVAPSRNASDAKLQDKASLHMAPVSLHLHDRKLMIPR